MANDDSRRLQRLVEVTGPVSRETFDRLSEFERRFQHWATRLDLVAPSTLDEVWERHVIDSAQGYPLLRDAPSLADVGSGGGFPGAVLAILGWERRLPVTLIESNRKKAAFLTTNLLTLAPSSRVTAERFEKAVARIEHPAVVSARALAPLQRLLDLLNPWLSLGTRGLFYKGRDYRREVSDARDVWHFDLVEHASRTEPNGVLLEVSNVQRRGDAARKNADPA